MNDLLKTATVTALGAMFFVGGYVVGHRSVHREPSRIVYLGIPSITTTATTYAMQGADGGSASGGGGGASPPSVICAPITGQITPTIGEGNPVHHAHNESTPP